MKRKGSRLKAAIIIVCAIGAVCAGAYAYNISGIVDVAVEAAAIGPIAEVVDEAGTVTAAKASMVAAKNNYDIASVFCDVGDQVEAGALLMLTDVSAGEADVMSLQAQANGLTAQLEQARRNAEQLKALYDNGAVSLNEYETAETAAKGLESQLQSLRHTIRSVQDNIQTNRVESPVAGTVTELFVSEGDTVIMGSPLVEISDLSDMYINVSLIAGDAEKVRIGGRVIIEDSEKAGEVRKISPKVVETMSELGLAQKRVDVEIAVDDQSGFILGSDKDLKIVVEEKASALLVPRRAVFAANEKDYVYLVTEGKAEQREVSVGIKGEEMYEIMSGLQEGDAVIVSPDDSVVDGVRVKIQ
ncbi:MAG: efflux RND transporter periplasmic adaptor subunit [Clostridiales Family XIII bacterium]|jgi:HlyD family secretion protein|nr:efflux RND transporter periplasmic adaptor subunit [Clostridiales Family XIII bacterium]